MTEQKLREKIAKTLELADGIEFSGEKYIPPISLEEKILLVEVNLNPKTRRPFAKILTPLGRTKIILALIKEAGYVKLAEDQRWLAFNTTIAGYSNCQSCGMEKWEAGWRKMEVKG